MFFNWPSDQKHKPYRNGGMTEERLLSPSWPPSITNCQQASDIENVLHHIDVCCSEGLLNWLLSVIYTEVQNK